MEQIWISNALMKRIRAASRFDSWDIRKEVKLLIIEGFAYRAQQELREAIEEDKRRGQQQ